MKPFLKWVGGKTQILHEVLPLIPSEINNYYEPFLGGGSVLLAVLSSERIKIRGKIYASDLNINLIALYKNIQLNPVSLIEEVKKLIKDFSECDNSLINRKPQSIEEAKTSKESYYYWIRSRFNQLQADERMSVQASAMLLFMNKTCFRGVYREGPNGFNVPYGNYKQPQIIDENQIIETSKLIKNVVFTCCPFEQVLSDFEKDDFIYLDPPYAPETNTSFVSYTSDGFSIDKHIQLFDKCNELAQSGVKFLMSNADVSLVKDHFASASYTIKVISCRRAINSKKPDAKTNEVLVLSS